MSDESRVDEPAWQDDPEWEVSVGPDLPGPQASVVLRLSKNGRTVQHRLDAATATRLSNALIAQAERARFQAARRNS